MALLTLSILGMWGMTYFVIYYIRTPNSYLFGSLHINNQLIFPLDQSKICLNSSSALLSVCCGINNVTSSAYFKILFLVERVFSFLARTMKRVSPWTEPCTILLEIGLNLDVKELRSTVYVLPVKNSAIHEYMSTLKPRTPDFLNKIGWLITSKALKNTP